MHAKLRPARRGFTLVELLVVIAIVGLICAVALPVVLPALNERKISEAARLVQAVLAGARDNAVRAGAPRGVRFLIDPIYQREAEAMFGGGSTAPLASNRMIAIEPGPDYSEGFVRHPVSQYYIAGDPTSPVDPAYYSPSVYLRVSTSGRTSTNYNSPTGWSYNIRQGDKIRFNGTGNYYTIAGPIASTNASQLNSPVYTYNPERYIICPPMNPDMPLAIDLKTWQPEFLNLTNGVDDDGDGWIDEGYDGIDNDNDGVIDPGFNGLDDDKQNGVDDPAEVFFHKFADGTFTVSPTNTNNEYEPETFVGTQASSPPTNDPYIIYRRPVISSGARETTLPDGIVIDLTTWNAPLPERSRLPVDPYTGYVDIMLEPNGQVAFQGAGNGSNFARSPIGSLPFYHFWLTEREGIHNTLWDKAIPDNIPAPNPDTKTPRQRYLLPMPEGTSKYLPMPNSTQNPSNAYGDNPVFLTGGRRLVTLFTKTGQVMTTSIESFNADDVNMPYYAAQTGIKEPQ